MRKTNRDESLRALLRLLIDEIVEDLSRTGSGSWGTPRCGVNRQTTDVRLKKDKIGDERRNTRISPPQR